MRFRDWFNDEREQQLQNPSPVNPAGSNLDQLRQEGLDFLTAGDEAINRTLSSNSEAFLTANRQQGGQ